MNKDILLLLLLLLLCGFVYCDNLASVSSTSCESVDEMQKSFHAFNFYIHGSQYRDWPPQGHHPFPLIFQDGMSEINF